MRACPTPTFRSALIASTLRNRVARLFLAPQGRQTASAAPAHVPRMPPPPVRSVLWFRKGLRLHDNPALLAALEDATEEDGATPRPGCALLPLFCLDPWFVDPAAGRVGRVRLSFLLESLADLDASLRKRGSRLVVARGAPETVLPAVVQEWGATRLCFEGCHEPYGRARDAAVVAALAGAGGSDVDVRSRDGATLWDPAVLVALNGGAAPSTYAAFQKLVARAGPPPDPAADAPTTLPEPGSGSGGSGGSGRGWEGASWLGGGDGCVPSMSDLGWGADEEGTAAGAARRSARLVGGETSALAGLAEAVASPAWLRSFDKPKTDPTEASAGPGAGAGTTQLSPHLKFGTLSPRRMWRDVSAARAAASGPGTDPPVSLAGQLLWREHFSLLLYSHGDRFTRMEGNPVCRQIDWGAVDEEPYRSRLAAWKAGTTGYPAVDAWMRQLRATGWLHHLARHVVACFLTRGDLWVSWEEGRDWFDLCLVDADPALNAANWMWLSCSAFHHQAGPPGGRAGEERETDALPRRNALVVPSRPFVRPPPDVRPRCPPPRPPVLESLQPRRLRPEVRQEWQIRAAVVPGIGPHAGQIHLRGEEWKKRGGGGGGGTRGGGGGGRGKGRRWKVAGACRAGTSLARRRPPPHRPCRRVRPTRPTPPFDRPLPLLTPYFPRAALEGPTRRAAGGWVRSGRGR